MENFILIHINFSELIKKNVLKNGNIQGKR